jgi:hypothetical protein
VHGGKFVPIVTPDETLPVQGHQVEVVILFNNPARIETLIFVPFVHQNRGCIFLVFQSGQFSERLEKEKEPAQKPC